MPRTFTIEEAAQELGISRALAYRAAASGALPALRIGGRVLVLRAALERMLTSNGGSDPMKPRANPADTEESYPEEA
jgi:excisionase family DNA binding protein